MLLFLIMFEHLKAAIEERVGLGYKKEEILAELEKFGYEGEAIKNYVGTFFPSESKPKIEAVKSLKDEETIFNSESFKNIKKTAETHESENAKDLENIKEKVTGGEAEEKTTKSSEENFISEKAEPENDADIENQDQDSEKIGSAFDDSKSAVFYSGFNLQSTKAKANKTEAETSADFENSASIINTNTNETEVENIRSDTDFTLPIKSTQNLSENPVQENWDTKGKNKKASKLRLVFGISVFVLFLGLVVVGLFIFLKQVNYNAPYQNVSELLSGIYENNVKNLDSFATDNHLSLVIGKKEAGVPVVLPEFFVGLNQAAPFGEDVSFAEKPFVANFYVSSKIDQREKTEPKADVKIDFDFEFDSLKMKAGGSLLLLGNKIFGRIDSIPLPMEEDLQGVPKGVWLVILEDSSQIFDLVQRSDWFNVPDDLFKNTQVFVRNNESFKEYIALIAQAMVASPVKNGGQLAQVADYLNTLSPEERELAERLIEKIHQVWLKYPFLKLATEPSKVTIKGETVFHYPLKVDEENVPKFMEAVDEVLLEETGVGGMVSYVAKEIDFIKHINTFNEVVKMSVNVRPDGTLHGSGVEIAFASGEGENDYQLKFTLENTYHSFGKVFDISEPAEVYPKTLEEIMQETQGAKGIKKGGGDASVRENMSNLRSQAEIFYNTNSFSYLGMCSDAEVVHLLDNAKKYGPASAVTYCNADGFSWAAAAKLNNADRETGAELFFCVDSTGRAVATSKILYSELSCDS